MRPEDLLARLEAGYAYDPMYGQLCNERDQLKAENAKLRDALKALMMGTNAELCADRDELWCKECFMHHGKDGCAMVDAMELLGIDMFGEPLGVES